MELADGVALAAALGVWIRFSKFYYLPTRNETAPPEERQQVSIIVPARNEADNLRKLLPTLHQLNALEIIVANDRSDDATVEVATSYGARVIQVPSRPEQWVAKSWACHQAAQHARGRYLLFTDADTIHQPESLGHVLAYLKHENADMLSASPWHLNQLWWEKLLGPFYCFVYAGASPYDKPRRGRAYAVGQYILFQTQAYARLKGHESVKDALAEDAALAQHAMDKGAKFVMYCGAAPYKVQMYDSIKAFIKGWTRQLRMGMRYVHFSVAIYSLLPLIALNIIRLPSMSFFAWLPLILTLICFGLVQARLGNFSIWG